VGHLGSVLGLKPALLIQIDSELDSGA